MQFVACGLKTFMTKYVMLNLSDFQSPLAVMSNLASSSSVVVDLSAKVSPLSAARNEAYFWHHERHRLENLQSSREVHYVSFGCSLLSDTNFKVVEIS